MIDAFKNYFLTFPVSLILGYEQWGEASIRYICTCTFDRGQNTSQEILKVVSGHNCFRAMHSQEIRNTIDFKTKGQGGKMQQVKGQG